MQPLRTVSLRQLKLVSTAGEAVGSIFLTESERNTIDLDTLFGQQLGGIAVSSLKIGSTAECIIAEAMAVEGKGQRLIAMLCRMRGNWRENHLEGLHAVRLDFHLQ